MSGKVFLLRKEIRGLVFLSDFNCSRVTVVLNLRKKGAFLGEGIVAFFQGIKRDFLGFS